MPITKTGMLSNDMQQVAQIEWNFAHSLIDRLRSVRNTLNDREMKVLAERVQGISKDIDDAMKYRQEEIFGEAKLETREQARALNTALPLGDGRNPPKPSHLSRPAGVIVPPAKRRRRT